MSSSGRPTRSAELLLSFTEEMHRQGREVQTRLINLVVEYAMSAMRPGYPIETVMERRPTPDCLA
jgi:hypothetical protein